MNFEEKKDGDILILKPISRNIDVTVSTEIKGKFVDLINRGNNFFILTLSQVEFVDSSGLGALISILKTIALNNGDMVLCELNNPVMSLLKLTRMTNIFKICPTEQEGIQLLSTLRQTHV